MFLIPIGVLVICVLLAAGYIMFGLFFPKKMLYISPLALHPDRLSASIVGQKTQEIRSLLQANHISFGKITAQDSTTFVVVIPENGEVIISSQKDITGQVASLQLILARLTMEGKHFSRLDFRYAKPVIVLR